MELELLTEAGFTIDFSKKDIRESLVAYTESKKGALVITLPVCKLDTPTANGRIYTSEMMTKAIQSAKESIENRRLLCSADDHPSTTHVAPINASHAVVDAWVKDGLLWNKWEVTETTNGKNLRALIEGGFSVGTSIRGLGRQTPSRRIEDYCYLGTDGVGNPAAGTYALPGAGGVTVEIVESVNNNSYKKLEYTGIPIPGVGQVNQNSIINFRGQSYRVSNIAGSPDRYQMTLYSTDDSNPHSIHVMSDDIKNASSEIQIIKEGSEEYKSMSKLNKVMESVREAADKLQKIRESGNLSDEMKFIAAFEYGLSTNSELSGSELKKVQEAWDVEKTKKTTKVEETSKVEKIPVELQIENLNTRFSEFSKMVEASLAPLLKVSEEEQRMIAVMKSAPYNLDEGTISEVLQAYLAHPDNEKMFSEELVSRVGNKLASVDLSQLFKDVTSASGDYQRSGDTGNSPNYATEKLEQENEALNTLLSEFCDKLEAGDLLDRETVVAQVEKIVDESRKSVRRYQVREALVTEMLVEQIMYSAPIIRALKTYKESMADMWVASQIIISQLREALMKKENKIVTESLEKDIVQPKVKRASRTPGWK